MLRYARLPVHTLSHFAVDYCCFYILFAFFSRAGFAEQTVAAGFLLYNVVAFGLQAFIGYFCDTHPIVPAARVGCTLTLLAVLLGALLPGKTFSYAAMLLCALGNAFYHVGGGVDTLLASRGKMADNGVFVASGSLGVLFGTLAGRSGADLLIPAAVITVCLLLQMLVRPLHGVAAPFRAVAHKRAFPIALMLLLAAIVLRAYVGFTIPTPWKADGISLCLPAFAAFLGKAAGGFAADRFGARMAGCVALAISAVLLTLFSASMPLCAFGIFLFNIPMPVTLCACCDLLPEHPGLSFGLTTLALLLGVLPTFFFILSDAAVPWTVGMLTIAAFACLMVTTEGSPQSPC